jgi:hypothetical protein
VHLKSAFEFELPNERKKSRKSPGINQITAESFNLLNAKLNLICHILPLLEAHHILHVSRIRAMSGGRIIRSEINKFINSIFNKLVLFLEGKESTNKGRITDFSNYRGIL